MAAKYYDKDLSDAILTSRPLAKRAFEAHEGASTAKVSMDDLRHSGLLELLFLNITTIYPADVVDFYMHASVENGTLKTKVNNTEVTITPQILGKFLNLPNTREAYPRKI
ncbi:hypothetical protein Dimus_006153, partial [Dionaea muscipula]